MARPRGADIEECYDVVGECWVWRHSRTHAGYGVATIGGRSGRQEYTHRLMYERHVGPIPPTMTIDHLCRNRACMNPAHLEAVTPGENVRRGWEARGKTIACKHGHKRTPENTYIRPDGHQECRPCSNARSRKYKRSKRTKPGATCE